MSADPVALARRRLYVPSGRAWWAKSHAAVPTLWEKPGGGVRVFHACVDAQTVSRVGYVDLDDDGQIEGASPEPVFDVGAPGTFDDNGINPTCLIDLGDRLRLYYVGFQLQRKISYTLFSGVAESVDGGESFQRLSRAPILDRSDAELFFRTAPWVMRDGGLWRCWYVAGSDWVDAGNGAKPSYAIHHATSADGVSWPRAGTRILDPRTDAGEIGFGRPVVLRTARGYVMLYSIRRASGYTLGVAWSDDGLAWTRQDDRMPLRPATTGWDSEMVCFAAYREVRGRGQLFYNGNGYGRTGFGVAELPAGQFGELTV